MGAAAPGPGEPGTLTAVATEIKLPVGFTVFPGFHPFGGMAMPMHRGDSVVDEASQMTGAPVACAECRPEPRKGC